MDVGWGLFATQVPFYRLSMSASALEGSYEGDQNGSHLFPGLSGMRFRVFGSNMVSTYVVPSWAIWEHFDMEAIPYNTRAATTKDGTGDLSFRVEKQERHCLSCLH